MTDGFGCVDDVLGQFALGCGRRVSKERVWEMARCKDTRGKGAWRGVNMRRGDDERRV